MTIDIYATQKKLTEREAEAGKIVKARELVEKKKKEKEWEIANNERAEALKQAERDASPDRLTAHERTIRGLVSGS